VLYLNPVVRFEGTSPPAPVVATMDTAGTWLTRAAFGVGSITLVIVYSRRRRASSPTAAPRTVLADAKRKPA
jgi:hypothetical protein